MGRTIGSSSGSTDNRNDDDEDEKKKRRELEAILEASKLQMFHASLRQPTGAEMDTAMQSDTRLKYDDESEESESDESDDEGEDDDQKNDGKSNKPIAPVKTREEHEEDINNTKLDLQEEKDTFDKTKGIVNRRILPRSPGRAPPLAP